MSWIKIIQVVEAVKQLRASFAIGQKLLIARPLGADNEGVDKSLFFGTHAIPNAIQTR
jgi:hypothetical protein